PGGAGEQQPRRRPPAPQPLEGAQEHDPALDGELVLAYEEEGLAIVPALRSRGEDVRPGADHPDTAGVDSVMAHQRIAHPLREGRDRARPPVQPRLPRVPARTPIGDP